VVLYDDDGDVVVLDRVMVFIATFNNILAIS
jgi:hypothetical protein